MAASRGRAPPACGLLALVLAFVAVAAMAGRASAASSRWSPADLPSPQDHGGGGVCGHGTRRSAVCDPDGLLPDDAVKVVDGLVNFVAAGTHGYAKVNCPGRSGPVGFQLAVAVVQNMAADWEKGRNMDERAKMFTEKLHDAWGVGDAECNNGVVLFVAVGDRRMHVSTGRGARKFLTDDKVQRVLEHMKPALRSGRLDLAIESGVDDIGKALAGRKIADDEDSGPGIVAIIIGFFIGIPMLASCFGKRSQYQRCQSALQRLESDRGLARQSRYEAVSCPICLEEFARTSPPPSPSTSAGLEAGARVRGAATSYDAVPHCEDRSRAVRRASAGCASSDAAKGSSPNTTQPGTWNTSAHGKSPVQVSNGIDENNSAEAGSSSAGQVSGTGEASSAVQTLRAGGNAVAAAEDDSMSQFSTQVLQCGHKFHSSCLRSMLEASHEQCPVCRKPLFGRDDAGGRDGHENNNNNTNNNDNGPSRDEDDLPDDLQSRAEQRRGQGDWAMFYPEYIFRLHRARYLYPRFVTVDMVDRWSREDYDRPLTTDPAFRALDPAVVNEARTAGSGGSSFSYGGGGSSGGGGGGSSW